VTSDTPSRPLPSLEEPDTGPFWQAAAQRRLAYQRCTQCDAVVFPPRAHCAGCMSLALEWQTSQGLGTVHTCTTTYQHTHPYFRSRTPYTIGLVDVDEGFRILAEIGAADGEVEPGSRVRVDWEEHGDVCVPIFIPVPGDE
jgi:uncharacterized protein